MRFGPPSAPFRSPTADGSSLGDLVREHEARLVVIDPLSAHLEGRIDSWKDQGIRSALAPLAALAEDRGLAVLVVAHLNKGQSGDPLQRLGGSIGRPAAARSVLLLARDPDDPDGEQGNRRVLAHVKSNFGKQAVSLAFADLLGQLSVTELPAVAAEAVEFLKSALAEGPRRARDMQAEADEAGIPWETVKRAKKPAGVKTRKERGVQNGPWVGVLEGEDPIAELPAA